MDSDGDCIGNSSADTSLIDTSIQAEDETLLVRNRILSRKRLVNFESSSTEEPEERAATKNSLDDSGTEDVGQAASRNLKHTSVNPLVTSEDSDSETEREMLRKNLDTSINIPPSDHSYEDEDEIEDDSVNHQDKNISSVVSIDDSSDDMTFSTPPEEFSKRRSMKTPKLIKDTSIEPACFIDLTQDPPSPLGASAPLKMEPQIELQKVVVQISALKHDIDSNQVILDTVDVHSLPDQGRNIKKKITNLMHQKKMLELKLETSEAYAAQAAALQTYADPTPNNTADATSSSSRGHVEEEVELLDESHSLSVANSSIAPAWGDLPKPDMTLAGLGKRALNTHFTEKSLTLETLSSLHDALKSCPSEETLEEDPKGLKVELMPHQQHGLAWMLWREQGNPSGGILADDMGLGKTLSMIALILKDIQLQEDSSKTSSEDDDDDDVPSSWLNSKYSRMYPGGTLVVCPASLMTQWENEIKKRTKRGLLSVILYHGSNRESRPRKLAKYDVVLTTYQLLGREAGVDTAKTATVLKEKGPLFFVKWDRVILDEAHIVRNHKSVMARGVCELVARHRWCLTGTPIHNKELDLYALLKFLRCSPFDDLAVWKRWVDNKDRAGMQRLHTMMKSLLLRRTKEQLDAKGELKSLPGRTSQIIDVHLDPEELEVYEKIAEYSRTLFAQFLGQRAEKQQFLDARYGFSTLPTWQQGERPDDQFQTTADLAQLHLRMQGLTEIKAFQILLLLLRLRQTCCHPQLVTTMVTEADLDSCDSSDKDVEEDMFKKMSNLNITDENSGPAVDSEFIAEQKERRAQIMSLNNPVFSLDRPSAKIRAVLEVLEEKVIGSDDKAIVVSQWTSLLNIMLKYLKEKGVKCETFSGEVPVIKRQNIIDAFNRKNSGPKVLLLSLTAGGVGLNLVGANHLLLIDIHWNPQLEAQACDRIYRFGQKKHVYIYRFITVDTIEERVKKMQEMKLALAEDVLTGTKNSHAAKLTLDDLKMLFNVGVKQPHPLKG